MSYLINPAGRYVAVEDPKKYKEYINTPGWVKPTDEEEKEHIRQRFAMIQSMQNKVDANLGIYISTVSEGGKDGYGVASKYLIQELQKAGETVTKHYTGQKIALLFHNPYSILRIESNYRILYTMFESDKIPDDWRDYLEAADIVLVPSKWCQSVFKKAGIETKVVPLGFDDNLFKYHKRENKREAKKPFTFLHYNAFNIRKGFPEVFKAFVKAFDQTEPVRMIFKSTLQTMPLPINKNEYPNIDIILEKYTDKQMVDLLNESDCFVFPSRGEGFGMTPLEAMATGLPTIVPNAHGITEYFNSDYMYEVKIKEECPALYSRYKNQDVGKMYISDVDHLASQMRYIYEHQADALQMGLKASEYVKQWTFKNTAKKLKAVIDDARMQPMSDRPLRNILTVEKIT